MMTTMTTTMLIIIMITWLWQQFKENRYLDDTIITCI